MEFSARGRELIRDVRETTRREVPIFNRRTILTMAAQLTYLYKKNTKDASLISPETSRALVPIVKFRHAVMEYQIRVMLAYIYIRLAKLRRSRWYYGATLPQFINRNSTEQDLQYFFNYSRLLSNYMRSIGDEGLDLTSMWQPLKTHMVQVDVLRDWEIVSEDGNDINLLAGSIQALPSEHFELLFKLGVVRIHKANLKKDFTRF